MLPSKAVKGHRSRLHWLTMPSSSSTFNLQDRLTSLTQDPELYAIDYENDHDVESWDARQIDHRLDGAVEAIVSNSSGVAGDPEVQEAYDVLQALLKHYIKLNGAALTKLLDAICSALVSEAEQAARDLLEQDSDPEAHREPLERYAFLLQWVCQVAEKLSAGGSGARGTAVGEENAAAAAASSGAGAPKKVRHRKALPARGSSPNREILRG